MSPVMQSKTVTVAIDRPPADVYRFVSNPENFPQWAAGLGHSVRRSGRDWIVETSAGPMRVRFAPPNDYGVVDHVVTPAPGVEILVPMRVVPNGSGSEIHLTVFQTDDMSDEKLAADLRLVETDLRTLKTLLERR
jgi:uncharacterized protein YndB with AHSA1/START domain